MAEGHLFSLAFVLSRTNVTDTVCTQLCLLIVVADNVDDFQHSLAATLGRLTHVMTLNHLAASIQVVLRKFNSLSAAIQIISLLIGRRSLKSCDA